VAEENSAEKIARLEREIETLKKENERLRGKRRLSRGGTPKHVPKNLDANQGESTDADVVVPSPEPSMR
jgi:hypothetical protein